jgi:hypothetical protein
MPEGRDIRRDGSDCVGRPSCETETGKQIRQGLEGFAEGLAAALAPKQAPPKQERPIIKMKGK